MIVSSSIRSSINDRKTSIQNWADDHDYYSLLFIMTDSMRGLLQIYLLCMHLYCSYGWNAWCYKFYWRCGRDLNLFRMFSNREIVDIYFKSWDQQAVVQFLEQNLSVEQEVIKCSVEAWLKTFTAHWKKLRSQSRFLERKTEWLNSPFEVIDSFYNHNLMIIFAYLIVYVTK